MTTGAKRYIIATIKTDTQNIHHLFYGPYMTKKEMVKEKARILKKYPDKLRTDDWPKLMTVKVEEELY